MTNRKKIELQVLNISNSQTQTGAFALLLGEVNGLRKLPILIGAPEAQAMLIELRGVFPPRPLTHNLFASVLEQLNVMLLRVLIYKVENKIFYSYLYLKNDETILRVDARTSDAVALALRMGAPILTYKEILESECLKIDESENSLTPAQKEERSEEALSRLQNALQKAIKEEDYERAAFLRDEISQYNNR